MDPVVVLRSHGPMRWRQLRPYVPRRSLARAVAAGLVVKSASGAYALPAEDNARVAAASLRGVRSHLSAASHHGLALVERPSRLHVTVPRGAKRLHVPPTVELHYRSLAPEEVAGDVTTPVRTVLDCLRDLPLREALAVGDSALALRLVTADELDRRAAELVGPGSATVRRRLALLDARAANAFESACRATLIEAGITGFRPQVDIRRSGVWMGRVDLADIERRVVIECDSFAYHASRAALRNDCRRYTALARLGFVVLRFSWEDVVLDPAWVAESVAEVVAARARKTEQARRRPRQAA